MWIWHDNILFIFYKTKNIKIKSFECGSKTHRLKVISYPSSFSFNTKHFTNCVRINGKIKILTLLTQYKLLMSNFWYFCLPDVGLLCAVVPPPPGVESADMLRCTHHQEFTLAPTTNCNQQKRRDTHLLKRK